MGRNSNKAPASGAGFTAWLQVVNRRSVTTGPNGALSNLGNSCFFNTTLNICDLRPLFRRATRALGYALRRAGT
jgi:ubiquitin C-terminal hydrolase